MINTIFLAVYLSQHHKITSGSRADILPQELLPVNLQALKQLE